MKKKKKKNPISSTISTRSSSRLIPLYQQHPSGSGNHRDHRSSSTGIFFNFREVSIYEPLRRYRSWADVVVVVVDIYAERVHTLPISIHQNQSILRVHLGEHSREAYRSAYLYTRTRRDDFRCASSRQRRRCSVWRISDTSRNKWARGYICGSWRARV